MIDEERLKAFLESGLSAQLAVLDLITKWENEQLLVAVVQKAAATGNQKDLSAYLKLRRELG